MAPKRFTFIEHFFTNKLITKQRYWKSNDELRKCKVARTFEYCLNLMNRCQYRPKICSILYDHDEKPGTCYQDLKMGNDLDASRSMYAVSAMGTATCLRLRVSRTVGLYTNLVPFLANVNSRSRSLYAIARPSVVCLSVCLSVVCLSVVCL